MKDSTSGGWRKCLKSIKVKGFIQSRLLLHMYVLTQYFQKNASDGSRNPVIERGGGIMESLRKIERYFDLFEGHRVFWSILISIFLEIPLQLYIRMHIFSPWILNKTSFVSIHIQKFDQKKIYIKSRNFRDEISPVCWIRDIVHRILFQENYSKIAAKRKM